MRACVQTDDGEHLGWLEVKQGLRQGHLLVPLLLDVFFEAVPPVVLARLHENEGIMTDMAHLEKQGVGGAGWGNHAG